MGDFLKMDIFFFVTTIAVVVVGIFIGFVWWRVNRILKNIEHISKQVALESELVRQDLAEMRSDIREGKGRLKSLLGFIGKFTKKTPRKP